jgi:hypothetical protein
MEILLRLIVSSNIALILVNGYAYKMLSSHCVKRNLLVGTKIMGSKAIFSASKQILVSR